MTSASPPGPSEDWKRYPFVIPGCHERWFTFPAAEGDQGVAENSYVFESRLHGVKTGRELACLVEFARRRVPIGPLPAARSDSYLLAFFDLTAGTYGTMAEVDGPRATPLRGRRMSIERGLLDVRFRTGEGPSRWTSRRDAGGAPDPFHYALDLCGRDHNGQTMSANLDVSVGKPPAPIGGDELRGDVIWHGRPGSHSYFQTGLSTRGRLRWGEFEDDVEGDCGWIERRYAESPGSTFADRLNARHRHERCTIHLDNGWDLGVWAQFDSDRGDRLVPSSGVTAEGPDGEIRATTDFRIERLSFVRDPEIVVPARSLATMTAYVTDRFHLSVRDWGLSLTAEPYVEAPAHAMSVDHWAGPVRFIGEMAGRPVSGFGFHERSKVWWKPHDLVFVLRETLRHMPASSVAGANPQALANRVWQCDVFLAHRDIDRVRRLLRKDVAPGIGSLPAPGRAAASRILDDLLAAL